MRISILGHVSYTVRHGGRDRSLVGYSVHLHHTPVIML